MARREGRGAHHDARCLRPRVHHLRHLPPQFLEDWRMDKFHSDYAHVHRRHTDDLVDLFRITPPHPQPAGLRDDRTRTVVRLRSTQHAHRRPQQGPICRPAERRHRPPVRRHHGRRNPHHTSQPASAERTAMDRHPSPRCLSVRASQQRSTLRKLRHLGLHGIIQWTKRQPVHD